MRSDIACYQPVLDFDGTLAETHVPSPQGVNVEEAYRRAFDTLAGKRGILAELNGVQNRTPLELVIAAKERGLLKVSRQRNTRAMSEELVRLKLDMLLAEISRVWPKPCAGAIEYIRAVRVTGKPVVILSSGHEPFVRKWFEICGLEPPDVMLTDDDTRPIPGLGVKEKSKPSPMLFLFLERKARASGVRLDRPLAYAGDSPEKDGTLARNVGVPFWWFNPTGKQRPIGWRPTDLEIRDWRELCS